MNPSTNGATKAALPRTICHLSASKALPVPSFCFLRSKLPVSINYLCSKLLVSFPSAPHTLRSQRCSARSTGGSSARGVSTPWSVEVKYPLQTNGYSGTVLCSDPPTPAEPNLSVLCKSWAAEMPLDFLRRVS